MAGPTASDTSPIRKQWAEWDAQITPPDFDLWTSNPWGVHPRFLPHLVEVKDGLRPGDIHVDAVARYLYHIRDDSMAMRYGVSIARGNLYEPGVYSVRRKARWPSWTPTQDMLARDAVLLRGLENGMPPGPKNPLGSRALYLYVGDRDTYLRIHGTPQPESIGGRASSGCVRMIMPHINSMYESVQTGVTAYLYSPEKLVSEQS